MLLDIFNPGAYVLAKGKPDGLHAAGEGYVEELFALGRGFVKQPAEKANTDANGVLRTSVQKLTRETYLLPERVRSIVTYSNDFGGNLRIELISQIQ